MDCNGSSVYCTQYDVVFTLRHANKVEHLDGALVAEEARGVGREGADQNRADATEEGRRLLVLEDIEEDATDTVGVLAFGRHLQTRLHGVDRDGKEPVEDAGRAAGHQRATDARAALALGRQAALEPLVARKVEGRRDAVAQHRGAEAAVERRQAALAQQLAAAVDGAGVLALGALHLQHALDALERRQDRRREEARRGAGGRNVEETQLAVRLLGREQALADLVAKEAQRVHGNDAHQRRRHALVERERALGADGLGGAVPRASVRRA